MSVFAFRGAAGARRPSEPLREQLSRAGRIAEMMMGLPAGRVEDFRRPDPDCLRIGITSSLSCGRLRAVLRAYRSATPPTPVVISALNRAETMRRVRLGGLDVGIVCDGPISVLLDVQPLWREALYVVLPADHSLASAKTVDPARLAGETLLTDASGWAAPGVDAPLSTLPPMPMEPVHADRETVFNLVALGFGVALASSSALGAYYPGVIYRPVTNGGQAVGYNAVWRGDNRSPALRDLLGALRARDDARPVAP